MDNNSGEIKIKVLPRGNEIKKPEGKEKPKAQRRWIVYVGIAAFALGGFTFFAKGPYHAKRPAQKSTAQSHSQTDLASVAANRINNSVNRHMQDAEIQREIMRRTREMENAQFHKSLGSMVDEDLASLPEDRRAYGVQMDADESVDRVLEDINADNSHYNMESPADRITAKIANRKLLDEVERAEKVRFLSEYIRKAYDKGYEVVIDANLVVVDMKPLNRDKLVNINQVIDRLAKGQ